MNSTFQVSGHIVDPLNCKIYDATIITTDGRISSIIPAEGLRDDAPYILPGFIDSHVHIESSMLLPENFARLAVRHGTVGVIADPHEIANVLGVPGIDFMIENGSHVPFHFCFGLPSCVPCTGMETSGAVINGEQTRTLIQRPDIHFLAEMMNVPGVLFRDPDTLAKLAATRDAGKPIDGHAPGLTGEGLSQYASEGISTDHECTTLAEAQTRLDAGMKVLIREGSAAQDFESLSPLLADNADGLMFCSDDLHPDNLTRGHINLLVKRAIAKGYPLWNVLRAACVTPVRHYHMPCGLLQQGDSADFILVDNLTDFNILTTCIRGNIYNDLVKTPISGSWLRDEWPNNFHAEPITAADLQVIPNGKSIRVITAFNGSLLTGQEVMTPKVEGDNIVSDPERDVLKIVVMNRYQQSRPAIGFIKGFGLKNGAIASTVAHDSHNIVALGTSDEAIAAAINHVIELRGGIVVEEEPSNGHDVLPENEGGFLPLPIAGLISNWAHKDVAAAYGRLNDKVHALGCTFDAPFMTLAFMALPVIPELKMTDKGLFDVAKFEHTSPFVE